MTNQHDNNGTELPLSAGSGQLFHRVVSILDQARANVVRAVNGEMIIAYWLIGREIVEALQGGEDRAEYGERLIDDLSVRLTEIFGKGFSTSNLRYFRNFFLCFADRLPEIRHTLCGELKITEQCELESGIVAAPACKCAWGRTPSGLPRNKWRSSSRRIFGRLANISAIYSKKES